MRSSASSFKFSDCSFARAAPRPLAQQARLVCRANPSDQEGPSDRISEWALPNASEHVDWRDFRAQLVARSRAAAQRESIYPARPSAPQLMSDDWAHLISGPEKGCVLLANPLLFGNSQTYFDKAVILVIEHAPHGSMGIILNKPSDLLLENMNGVVLESQFEPFSKNKVYLGGDVDADGLYLLHEHNVKSAVEVRPGVYLGGAEDLCREARQGSIEPESVNWFCRYAGWAPHQLAQECKRHVWYPVSCSSSLLLPRIPTSSTDSSNLWHDIMELIGDDFKRVSETIRSDTSRPRMP